MPTFTPRLDQAAYNEQLEPAIEALAQYLTLEPEARVQLTHRLKLVGLCHCER